MNAEWLQSVGFVRLSRDRGDEEWGVEGDGVAVTVFPDEADPADRWFVRPRLDGGGVAIPQPKDEATALQLLSALGIAVGGTS